MTAAGWLAAAARGGWHRIASHVLAGWRRRRAAAASHGVDLLDLLLVLVDLLLLASSY